MAPLQPNETYYYEIGEGRWRGEFHFEIKKWREFLKANLPVRDRALAAFLHLVEHVPGKATMHGEIACDPGEDEFGIARVDVQVVRFGFEIYRLRGYYKLEPDGVGVRIKIYQRFGPHGSWLENEKVATAEILEGGFLGVYYMKIFGEDWVGKYRLDDRRVDLNAEYICPWGVTRELMGRLVPIKPQERRRRLRWDKLLTLARRLEARERLYGERDDPRALFTYAYGVVTRTIAFSMADIEYDDPDWVVTLAYMFACRYEKALVDYDAHDAPEAWRIVFDVLKEKSLSGIAELILCISVHILHDLPLALLEVGLEATDGRSRAADYDRMNAVLASNIDILQQRLAARYNPAFWAIDIAAGTLDEQLSTLAVDQMRSTAWMTASRMLDGQTRGEVVEEVVNQVRDLVDEVRGRDRPRRLLSRAVHGSIRLWRRTPRYPKRLPGELEALDMTPRLANQERVPREDHIETQEDILYGLHTAVGQARVPNRAKELSAAVPRAIHDSALARPKRFVADQLTRAQTWSSARREAERDEGLRWRVGALLASLGAADGATITTDDLGLADAQADAIRAFQSVMKDGLRSGFNRVSDDLAAVVKTLDLVGVPASATLGGFDDLRAHYDRESDLFVAEAPAMFRRKFEDIRWLIEPENWSRVIPHMVRSEWVEGPDDQRRGVLREVVNVYHPWIDNHPLVLENDLAITQEDTADERVVRYELDKSIDGSLELDYGHITLQRLGEDTSLLVIKKTIKVRADRNPLLYALLRTNPDGLAYLFTYWVNSVAARFGTPDAPALP